MPYTLTFTATRVQFRGAGAPLARFAHEGWTTFGPGALVEFYTRTYDTLAAARGQRTRLLREWADGREISPCGRSLMRAYPDGSHVISAVVVGREYAGHRDSYALEGTIAPAGDDDAVTA